MDPKILCLRVGFQPKYSSSKEFMMEGAVDYAPE